MMSMLYRYQRQSDNDDPGTQQPPASSPTHRPGKRSRASVQLSSTGEWRHTGAPSRVSTTSHSLQRMDVGLGVKGLKLKLAFTFTFTLKIGV